MEAAPTNLESGRERGDSCGLRFWDRTGKNASGKRHEPGKLWRAGVKGRGPREQWWLPGGTGHLQDDVMSPDFGPWTLRLLYLSLTLFLFPYFSQAGTLLYFRNQSVLSRFGIASINCFCRKLVLTLTHSYTSSNSTRALKSTGATSSVDPSLSSLRMERNCYLSERSSSWPVSYPLLLPVPRILFCNFHRA